MTLKQLMVFKPCWGSYIIINVAKSDFCEIIALELGNRLQMQEVHFEGIL